MVRKRSISKQVLQQLTDEFRSKTQLVDKLRRQNAELQSKQELLLAFYEVLQILQQQTSFNPELSTATEQLLVEQLIGLSAHSTTLDAVVSSVTAASVSVIGKAASSADVAASGLPYSSCAGTGDAASLPHSSTSGGSIDAACIPDTAAEDEIQLRCAAAPGDPLYLFKAALCHPQLGNEHISITMEELQADAVKTVKEVSYLLYQYEQGTYKTAYALDDPARPQPLKQIRDELLRHFQLACLAGFGKGSEDNFVLTYTSMPFDGSGKAGGPQEINHALYASTVKQLDLTLEQMDRILMGLNAFKGILDITEDEMISLLQHVSNNATSEQQQEKQQQQQMGSAGAPADVAAFASGANLMSAFSSLYKHLGNSSERSSKLQRLHLLLNKTFLVRSALLAYVFGCMTVHQCAKAFVGVSPFPLLVVPFCGFVAHHKEQLEQQQQQQRVAAASKSKSKP